MDSKGQHELENMYKSRMQASYFRTVKMSDPTKSRINEVDQIIKEDDQEIDQNTFKLQRNFKLKEDNYSVYKRSAFVYLETEPFLSCLASVTFWIISEKKIPVGN
jgi:hypothetical protein